MSIVLNSFVVLSVLLSPHFSVAFSMKKYFSFSLCLHIFDTFKIFVLPDDFIASWANNWCLMVLNPFFYLTFFLCLA